MLAYMSVIVLTGQTPFTAHLIFSNEDWPKYKMVGEKSKPTQRFSSPRRHRFTSTRTFASSILASPHMSHRWGTARPTTKVFARARGGVAGSAGSSEEAVRRDMPPR